MNQSPQQIEEERRRAAQLARQQQAGNYGTMPPPPPPQMQQQRPGTTVPSCYEPPVACQPRPECDQSIDLWRLACLLAIFASEFVGSFAIGLAFSLRDFWVGVGLADPGFVLQAGAAAAISVGMILAFLPFHSGHFNPMFTFVAWCCVPKKYSLTKIGEHLIRWLGQFLGYLIAAWVASALFAIPLTCTVINPLVGNGFAYLFETLGSVFLLHIFVLAAQRKQSGMMGILGLALAIFSLLVTFAPLTGGSFNFFRSTGVALVVGGGCGSSLGIYVLSMITALVVSITLLSAVFPEKCAPAQKGVYVAVTEQAQMNTCKGE